MEYGIEFLLQLIICGFTSRYCSFGIVLHRGTVHKVSNCLNALKWYRVCNKNNLMSLKPCSSPVLSFPIPDLDRGHSGFSLPHALLVGHPRPASLCLGPPVGVPRSRCSS